MEAMEKVPLPAKGDPNRGRLPSRERGAGAAVAGGAIKVVKFQGSTTPSGRPQPNDEGILKDYLRNSSFAIVRYALASDLRVSLKFFWLCVAACLAGVFGFTVTVCFERLRDPSNVFVGEAERPMPMWAVPFPAVTLCPRKSRCSGGITPRLEDICESVCWQDVCADDCGKMLDPVRTELGICYTFNAVAATQLFKNDSISNLHDLTNASRPTRNWDFLRGRQIINSVLVKQYPRAAQDMSGRYRLRIFTGDGARNESYADCPVAEPLLDAFVHSPIDFPSKPMKPVAIPPADRPTGVAQLIVHPQLVRSQRYLRYFTASTTGCISQAQNPLKHFAIYTQSNCEIECHTDHFLTKRGCLLEHMPRAHGGPALCNGSFAGYRPYDVVDRNAMAVLRTEGVPRSQYFRWLCNCLPACVEFRYRAELNVPYQAELPGLSYQGNESSEQLLPSTQLVVQFADDHFYPLVRIVRYNWLDFLANFGGLVALFLGLSIVSLFEIVFFCFLKPAVVR